MNEQGSDSRPAPATTHEAVTRPQVRLFAKASREGKATEWKLGFDNPPEQSKARVELAAKSGEHEIVFHLVATQGLDISFDKDDPIWVQEGTQCPPGKGIKTDQISVDSCTHNLLRISDRNDGPARILTYQLNFVGADAEPLDPEIKNGGTMII